MWPMINNMNPQTMMNRMAGLMNNFGFGGMTNNTNCMMNPFCSSINPAIMYGYPNAESYMTPSNTLYNMTSDTFNLIAKYNNTFYPSIYGSTNTSFNSMMNNSYYYNGF